MNILYYFHTNIVSWCCNDSLAPFAEELISNVIVVPVIEGFITGTMKNTTDEVRFAGTINF